MKKLSYIVILMALLVSACGKRSIVLTEDNIPEDIFYLENEIKPYTGTCLIYYKNTSVIKEEINFKNGILNGSHVSYYNNGKIKRQGYYLNGNLNGKWIGFDEKGQKIYEVEYKNDTLVGKFISWYSTGVIKEKGHYHNNKKTGEWLSYDESGMIVRKVML
jgi:antitoxin component YwqK of YwqJK toxin-antitoxin module